MKNKIATHSAWVRILPLFAFLGASSIWAQSYGPAMIWVNGNSLSFISHSDDLDIYGDGNGYTATLDSDGNVTGQIPGQAPWQCQYDSAQHFFDCTVADVRAADEGGTVLYNTHPTNWPQVFLVDHAQGYYEFLGTNDGSHHYAGAQPGERFRINFTDGSYYRGNNGASGSFTAGVLWTEDESDVRADSWMDNGPYPPPTGFPPAVRVHGSVWRFYGTSDSRSYYAGPNAMERLWIHSNGTAHIDITGGEGPEAYEGTYTGGNFTFPSYLPRHVIWDDGNPNNNFPGPSMLLVNSELFTTDAGSSNQNLRTYIESAGHSVTVHINGTAKGFDDDDVELWSGYYYPSTVATPNAGVFFIPDRPEIDVRAYNGQSAYFQSAEPPLSGHPEKVKIGGRIWTCAGHLQEYFDPITDETYPKADVYLGDQAGERLFVDENGRVSCWNSLFQHFTGNYRNNVFMCSGVDIRAYTDQNLPRYPDTNLNPQWGPAKVWMNGVTWSWLGTVDDEGLNVHADYYGGPNPSEILLISHHVELDNDGQVSADYLEVSIPSSGFIGLYQSSVFLVDGVDIRALDSSGDQFAHSSAPSNLRPYSLRIAGLQWRFLGSVDGIDYYAARGVRQRLQIDGDGNVTYSDPIAGVSGTGTYIEGVFSSTNSNLGFSAGTIASDLDVLGNTFSLGSLEGDASIAGFTLTFIDDTTNTQDHPDPSDLIMFAGARPLTTWLWARANTTGSINTIKMMELDASHTLKLYRPGNQALPIVEINPNTNGSANFNVPVRVNPAGDLLMGDYDHGIKPDGTTNP